jgi:hypothetical protein
MPMGCFCDFIHTASQRYSFHLLSQLQLGGTCAGESQELIPYSSFIHGVLKMFIIIDSCQHKLFLILTSPESSVSVFCHFVTRLECIRNEGSHSCIETSNYCCCCACLYILPHLSVAQGRSTWSLNTWTMILWVYLILGW